MTHLLLLLWLKVKQKWSVKHIVMYFRNQTKIFDGGEKQIVTEDAEIAQLHLPVSTFKLEMTCYILQCKCNHLLYSHQRSDR